MKNEKWYQNALMLNRDPCWYRDDEAIDDSSAENCRRSLENYFSRYEGAITDICLCVFEQTTLFPAESFMWRGEKYLQKVENGIAVDYTEGPEKKLYRCFAEYNVDAIQIFIDKMRGLGIRPWLALRMNDAHFGDSPTSFLHSDMFYEELSAGHTIGEKYDYYSGCFDFKYPRYKNALLNFIEETVGKYDVFGLELDFMRECHCFDYLNDPECHKIMTEYIREIRAVVDKAACRVGHDIKLSIRTCRSPRDAMAFGFDIKTLVAEGLVDLVIPTPRWSPSDSALPIGEWRELLGEDAPIFAGIETNNHSGTTNTPENDKAYVAAFYAQGADGIYFNNHEYYDSIYYNNHEYCPDRNRRSWRLTRENSLVGRREFVVLHQDLAAYEEWAYKPLPLEVVGEGEIPLEIGKIKVGDKVKVVIDFDGDEIPTLTVLDKVSVKGEKTEKIEATAYKKVVVLTPNTPVCYDISGIQTESPLTLKFSGKGSVTYIKIVIDAV